MFYNYNAKPLAELQQQWARSRAEALAKRAWYRSPAKAERNAEIIWLHDLGVPLNHIARLNGISVPRVRAIIQARGPRL